MDKVSRQGITVFPKFVNLNRAGFAGVGAETVGVATRLLLSRGKLNWRGKVNESVSL
jgi:hypothetical protein